MLRSFAVFLFIPHNKLSRWNLNPLDLQRVEDFVVRIRAKRGRGQMFNGDRAAQPLQLGA